MPMNSSFRPAELTRNELTSDSIHHCIEKQTRLDPSEMQIKDKTVLITGGANGLGFGYAKELLRNGAAHVAILDLVNSNGEKAVEKLNEEFGKDRAIFAICDVSKPKELEAGFAKTIEEFGGLDIVINNAGIMDDARWELMINVNFNGVVSGILLGLRHMGKNNGGKGGTIVNISSILGFMPMPVLPVYTGTKHAVLGLSRSFGQPFHYEKTGVRILTLCPSASDTEMMQKSSEHGLEILKPDEISAVVRSYYWQSIDTVVEAMIHVLRIGENGSVWLVMNGEPVYELDIPDIPARKREIRS